MPNNEIFAFNLLDFGTILGNLLKQDDVTNINCWYGRIIVSSNIKDEYIYDISSHTNDEILEYQDIIQKLPNRLANRMIVSYNDGSPILDAELEDSNIGRLRINTIHQSLNGSEQPAISIRKALMKVRITKADMINSKYTSAEVLNLLKILIEGQNNIMIAGATGSGKTELLRYIARYIRNNEAIITIEDTREAYLEENYPDKYVLALKTSNEFGFSELIKACLRQNPRWICLSETRGEEVIDLLSAVETGHKLISTIHTGSARAIPNRMVSMSKVNDGNETERIYKQVHENIDIGVYIDYLVDHNGSHRKITEIVEFYVDEQGKPKSHLICNYDYETGKYVYSTIQSHKIKQNLIKRKVDTSKVKGVFINA